MRLLPLLILLLCASATAQEPLRLAAERADDLVGFNVFDDGRTVSVFDLGDRLGYPQLVAVEFGSGRLRTLYPTDDGTLVGGGGWFAREPTTYALDFEPADGPPMSVTWHKDEAAVSGRKMAFREREIMFESDGETLAGAMILPPAERGFEAPYPGVVMVHGSGPLTRDGQRYVADLLAYHGVAVLVSDKRGVGGSTGMWNGLAHRAGDGDVRAALARLREQPEVDAGRVGLLASSEGGYVAPIVASTDDRLAFLACRVCAALPHDEVILDMEAAAMTRRGYMEAERDTALALLDAQLDYALRRDPGDHARFVAALEAHPVGRWTEDYSIAIRPADAPYWDFYKGVLEPAPVPLYETLYLPILALLGERDNRILAAPNREAFEEAFATAGNPDATVRVLPGGTHGLMEAVEGEGPMIRYVPDFHLELVSWIRQRVGLPPLDGSGAAE